MPMAVGSPATLSWPATRHSDTSPKLTRRAHFVPDGGVRELWRTDTDPKQSLRVKESGTSWRVRSSWLVGAVGALLVLLGGGGQWILSQLDAMFEPSASLGGVLPNRRRQQLKLPQRLKLPQQLKLPQRLNILYVLLEDFGTIGSSVFPLHTPGGAPNGTTPHLEALARRGVAFQRAYCSAPICNPSRSSMLTGRRPSHTRVFNNFDEYDAHVPPGTPHLVHFLRDADPSASVACSGGKIFHEACDSLSRGFSLPDASPPPPTANKRTLMALEALRSAWPLMGSDCP